MALRKGGGGSNPGENYACWWSKYEHQHEEEREYGIMRPDDLLGFDLDSENNGNNSVNLSSASTAAVTNLMLPNDEYYHMSTQLNEQQQHLWYVMGCKILFYWEKWCIRTWTILHIFNLWCQSWKKFLIEHAN